MKPFYYIISKLGSDRVEYFRQETFELLHVLMKICGGEQLKGHDCLANLAIMIGLFCNFVGQAIRCLPESKHLPNR